MKKFLAIIIAIIALTFSAKSANDYTGFKDSTKQHQLEIRFDALLSATDIDENLKYLSAHPHNLGSPHDKDNAEYILHKFIEWGYDARIDTFYALFPTPKTRVLEETFPGKYKASLVEPTLKEDATSSQQKEQLPGYNAYSADGDVTAELVYVNYGVPADYEELDKMGIDVKGKIVISRYGGAWRGIKPRLAQEHGAIGCIIYSDPKEDGYYQGDVYPKGPFRNERGVQRGSVLDMPMYPGDPLTPGYGDTKNAKRLDRKDVANLLKIPVIPISYEDAKPFLSALSGRVVPDSWRGALPITYHTGPGPVKAHLKLEFNWDLVPVYDVIAVMKGSERPDEWVIRGNHQDAWVNGAGDPLSGQVAMMEEAKAVGQLVKQGMRLKRTIVYCAWDGEEEGLLGSTEWAETNALELQKKAVAYINSDGNGRGFLGVGGSHTLQQFVNEAASDVMDPETGISVLDRKIAQQAVGAANPADQKKILSSSTVKIDALGSGSDFSSFLQHLGIAALDLGYGGEDGGGEYHSIYDSYNMYTKFKDPGFKYEVTLSKTAGRLTLRLANADVLPFNFSDFYTTVNDYTTELIKSVDDMRSSTEMTNKLINGKYYTYNSDPTKTFVTPKPKEEVPYLDFALLQNALAKLKEAIEQYDSVSGRATNLSASKLNDLNTLLYQAERKLLLDNGLPQRPWYKHSIYAPGYYTGYGVKTLPGIREAIENRDWKLAKQEMEVTAKTLDAYAGQVQDAVGVLKGK